MFNNLEVITEGNWERFLTLKDEELLLVKRKHPFIMIPTIAGTLLISFAFITSLFFFFNYLIPSIILFVINMSLILSVTLIVIAKIINDWFFHMYILTTRKILEVWYAPLSSHIVNDVMLDKVNCTEIDVRRHGIVNDLLDIGDIAITFDRPTRREEFVIQDIRGCYKLGVFLTQKLLDHVPFKQLPEAIWVRHGYSRAN